MLMLPASRLGLVRCLSTTTTVLAPKAATKGRAKPPPKKAAKQSFAKKEKGRSDLSSNASSIASKVGSTKSLAQLNKTAPRVALKELPKEGPWQEMVNNVFEIPETIYNQLAALEVLEKQAGHPHFSQLASVFRQQSADVLKSLQATQSSKDRRIILTGTAGCGKSTIMMQLMASALSQGWVVLPITNASSLVDSTFPYSYDEKRKAWKQDTYMAELLGRIADGNKQLLQLQNTSSHYSFDRHAVKENTSLYNLLDIGNKDATVAHAVFDVFMKELNIPGRPPVLMTLDNLSITTLASRYRDKDNKSVHPFDLLVLRIFIEHLNGTRTLPNGLVATCTSSRPACRARSLEIALGEAKIAPFEVVDERIMQGIDGATIKRILPYTSAEARSIVSYYTKAGLCKHGKAGQALDETSMQRHIGVGGATGREVLRSCLQEV